MKGEKGDRGQRGPVGPAGNKGDKRDKGDRRPTGPVGPTGLSGTAGDTFVKKTGDKMTVVLDMSMNRIENLAVQSYKFFPDYFLKMQEDMD